MDMNDFCTLVGNAVKAQFNLDDGDEMAFRLVERDEISVNDDPFVVAPVVAQYLLQA